MSAHGHGGEHSENQGHEKEKPVKKEKSIDEILNDKEFNDSFLVFNEKAGDEIVAAIDVGVKEHEATLKKWYKIFENRELVKKEFKKLFETEIKARFERIGKDIPKEVFDALNCKIDEMVLEDDGEQKLNDIIEEWQAMKWKEEYIKMAEEELEQVYRETPGGKEGLEEEGKYLTSFGKADIKKREAKAKSKVGFFKRIIGVKSAGEEEAESDYVAAMKDLRYRYGYKLKDIEKRYEEVHKFVEVEDTVKARRILLHTDSLEVMRLHGVMQAVEEVVQEYLVKEVKDGSSYEGEEVGFDRGVAKESLAEISVGVEEVRRTKNLTVEEKLVLAGIASRIGKLATRFDKNKAEHLTIEELGEFEKLAKSTAGLDGKIKGISGVVVEQPVVAMPKKTEEVRNTWEEAIKEIKEFQAVLESSGSVIKNAEFKDKQKIIADFIKNLRKNKDSSGKQVLSDEEKEIIEFINSKRKLVKDGMLTDKDVSTAAAMIVGLEIDKGVITKEETVEEKDADVKTPEKTSKVAVLSEAVSKMFETSSQMIVEIEKEKKKITEFEQKGAKRKDAVKVLKILEEFGGADRRPILGVDNKVNPIYGIDYLALVENAGGLSEEQAKAEIRKEIGQLVKNEVINLVDGQEGRPVQFAVFKKKIVKILEKKGKLPIETNEYIIKVLRDLANDKDKKLKQKKVWLTQLIAEFKTGLK
ncbi:MAG: hypothetical protein WC725_05565 [Patescibacteria group bacterium]|jgi:hypothetical protein